MVMIRNHLYPPNVFLFNVVGVEKGQPMFIVIYLKEIPSTIKAYKIMDIM